MILTYQQQLDLVGKGLAKASVNGKFTTFKYAKKVMYDYLWEKHPELKHCRGQTYDNTNGNIVTLPPAKTFNYLENGTWKDKPLDTPVTLFKKYNGFMAAMAIYQGEIVVSTTGTTGSDYAKVAKEEILKKYKEQKVEKWSEDCTWLFEICTEDDPHIVAEEFGCHYLGLTLHAGFDERFNPSGDFIYCSLGEALERAKTDKGEGWMMYTDEHEVCKLKTDYYVGKKKLMRMNKRNVEDMYNDYSKVASKLPAFWYNAPEYITRKITKDYWLEMTDQERRVILEDLKG